MTEASETASRPLAIVAARLSANLAGLSVALLLFALGTYLGGLLPTAPQVAGSVPLTSAASSAPRPFETAAGVSIPSAMPTPAPTPAPTAAPTAAPTPAPAAPAVSAVPYANGGRNYIALNVREGTTLTAPFSGRVQVLLYQLIDGDIRLNANDRTKPFFPYVTLVGSDRRMIYRPGAQTVDTQLVVEDGQTVNAGDALFRVVGGGPSSWNTFYDKGMVAQVLVSLAALPSGRELDPLPLVAPKP